MSVVGGTFPESLVVDAALLEVITDPVVAAVVEVVSTPVVEVPVDRVSSPVVEVVEVTGAAVEPVVNAAVVAAKVVEVL